VKQKIILLTLRMNGWQRASQKPGEIRMIRVTKSQEGDRTGRPLLTRSAAKGVRLLAAGVHTFYIVRALMGASLSVDCSRRQWRGNKSEV
jgi:predicted dehydrogenase